MKKTAILIMIFCFVFSATLLYAQYTQKTTSNVKSNEVKKSGGANIIAPKGSQLIKKDGATFVEGFREYASRKFTELEGRIKTLETDNSALKKSVDELKKTVAVLRKESTVSAQNDSGRESTVGTESAPVTPSKEPVEEPNATSQ